MNTNPKPTLKRARGLILTERGLKRLDQGLWIWWENSEAKKTSPTEKLTRERKAEGLEVSINTADRIYERRKPVDKKTLRNAFERLNITPPFSIKEDCVSSERPAGNLPVAPTTCIGRETQIAKIQALLKSNHLVTFTGVGGIGKTKLALQVAQEMKRHFVDGIWVVELAGLMDPTLVTHAVVITLGMREVSSTRILQELSDFFYGKQLLLILDNCEHLLDACASLANSLLSASSALRILATSRERLNIPFEFPYPISALSIPDLNKLSSQKEDQAKFVLDYDSVRLFVERAQLLHHDLTVTNQNASLFASICQNLDGIPLALELAAGRMDVLSLTELNRGLSDCFSLLIGRNRTSIPRHQTLQATMDWSYNLLDRKEQVLFRRLSVFADGCGLEAAHEVCINDATSASELLGQLASLVAKSLVENREREGKSRYCLLETVRQYGLDRLVKEDEVRSVRSRHRDYFLNLAEKAKLKLSGPEQALWLSVLEEEHDNLRTALRFCLEETEEGGKGLRLGGALQQFWYVKGHLTEGRQYLSAVLSLSFGKDLSKTRADALNGAGLLAGMQGDDMEARSRHEECLEIRKELGDKQGIAASLNNLGFLARIQEDYATARSLLENSLAIRRELGDDQGIALALFNLGNVAHDEGDCAKARIRYEDSLAIRRALGDKRGIAECLNSLGTVARIQGDYAVARSLLKESLAMKRELGDERGIANCLNNLGNVARDEGDHTTARIRYEECLAMKRGLGDKRGIAECLENLDQLPS